MFKSYEEQKPKKTKKQTEHRTEQKRSDTKLCSMVTTISPVVSEGALIRLLK